VSMFWLYLILFVPQLVIGAAFGWWMASRRGMRSKPSSSDSPFSKKYERELRTAMSRLKRLTVNVQDDVREHASTVDSSSKALADLSADDGNPIGALSAVATIIEANEPLQERLAMAEQKLAEQNEQLDKQMAESRTDLLTGLLNRRGLEEELEHLLDDARQAGQPLSLMMIDIDHFKKFNDQYGHDVGDLVLCDVGRAVSGAVRTMDVVARFGGEELVVLLPNGNLDESKLVVEQVRAAVQQQVTHDKQGRQLQVTISGGVAQVDTEDSASLLKRADLALYTAKEGGRNCTYYHDGVQCHLIDRLPETDQSDTRSDELTRLPSRLAFMEEMGRRIAEASRFRSELSLIVLEVDQFDQVVAEQGKGTADLLLRGLSQFLTELMREMDLVARNDTKGFAILLPNCTLTNAANIADRVRRSAAKSLFRTGDVELNPTLSAGVACARPAEDAETLLRRCEQALECCQESEGNCIFVDQPENNETTPNSEPSQEESLVITDRNV